MNRVFPVVAFIALMSNSCDKTTPPAAAPTSLPGAEAYSSELKSRLEQAVAAKGIDYKPRTRHLTKDGRAQFTNRLGLESSPYLQQHAHNPVNWYPWGDEAFATAKRLRRPVLLSIGYSTCHWCHVMEEESFEDIEIATYLNKNYIAIKVDREERPDVDSIYMLALQAMRIRGGWPLNVWLTPDRKPFFGGTYFPPRAGVRGARVGFVDVLKERKKSFDKDPSGIAEHTDRIAELVQRVQNSHGGRDLPSAEVLHAAATFYRERFDPILGGLKTRDNKFPSAFPNRLLLRYWRRTGDQSYLQMALFTLDRMAAGGMYDQIGGGFHRYSTDPKWLVPHFEKMLYDNALLVPAYLEAYQVSGEERFAEVARQILFYVSREMTSPEGGFYSATDADSANPNGEREEGWFFTWTPVEVERAVGGKAASLVMAYYDIRKLGNFEGRSIAHTPRSLGEVASSLSLSPQVARTMLDEAVAKMYESRSKRPPPLRDDKILAAWNGLMISAYARAARILGSDSKRGLEYAAVAVKAADFVLTKMRIEGRLRRSYHSGKAYLNGYLSDYAFVIAGLLDVYEATGQQHWLDEAIVLDKVLSDGYEDRKYGGYFMTSNDHEKLMAREKPSRDGAVPSGNSITAMNLLRLYEFTTDASYLERADKVFRAFAGLLARAPTALTEMLSALDFRLDMAKEVVIVTPDGAVESAAPFADVVAKIYLPNHVWVVTSEGKSLDQLSGTVPLVAAKKALGGRTTAYVCEQQRCDLPTSDPAKFAEQLKRVMALDSVPGAH